MRLFPSQKSFRIQDSNAFLASSLSLSFGVMVCVPVRARVASSLTSAQLFSALYRMLPSSAKYLSKAGWDHQQGALLVMVCFVVGFIGIQIISRVLHQFIPSHIVDCDHTHQHHAKHAHTHSHRGHSHSRPGRNRQKSMRTPSSGSTIRYPDVAEVNFIASESTPLLSGEPHLTRTDSPSQVALRGDTFPQTPNGHHQPAPPDGRRSSIMDIQNFLKAVVVDKPRRANCDESELCYGYSERCGQECRKLKDRPVLPLRPPLASHTYTTPAVNGHRHGSEARTLTQIPTPHAHEHIVYTTDGEIHSDPIFMGDEEDGECEQMEQDETEAQHHHHVPENAFLSISLQTVVAIALHKFPEGFIMYATNHASAALGFNVFMALFVHNIAEGFSMALPLYLAIGSRAKAIAWSSLLGGLTQPMGAGMAVLWFKLANRSAMDVDNTSYGCLFAVTAGIMTSVALQLFVESLSLNHNKNLSIFFAFLGMALLGFSSALVAE